MYDTSGFLAYPAVRHQPIYKEGFSGFPSWQTGCNGALVCTLMSQAHFRAYVANPYCSSSHCLLCVSEVTIQWYWVPVFMNKGCWPHGSAHLHELCFTPVLLDPSAGAFLLYSARSCSRCSRVGFSHMKLHSLFSV